jgi:putative tricarboxylic transport membrane protein
VNLKKADIIAGSIGLFISVYVIWEARHFPEDKVLLLGPHFFPTMLAVGLGLLSLGLIVLAAKGKSRRQNDPFNIRSPGVQRAALALIATVFYCLIFNFIGFIITSTIYLMFLMYLLRQRAYLKMLTIALGVTFLVYGVFHTLLDITLPAGFLG